MIYIYMGLTRFNFTMILSGSSQISSVGRSTTNDRGGQPDSEKI